MTVAKLHTPQVAEAMEAIAEALGVMHPATGDIWEIRAPETDRRQTVSGYYSDRERCARDVVAQLDGRAPAVYVTLNQINPALLARANNRLQDYAKSTTADADVMQRLWLPLDFDPVRPTGISASDVEHAEGLAHAEQVAAFLSDLGWPDPVQADSGNGVHLLYPIALPNDKDCNMLIKSVLEALARGFDEPTEPRPARVHLDTSVYNAARIWKLYGTVAGKGDDAPDLERPHRRARLNSVPTVRGLVTREQLEELCEIFAPLPGATEHSVYGLRARSGLAEAWIKDAGAYLLQYGVGIRRGGPISTGSRWVLDACVWNPDHTDHSAWVIQRTSDGAIFAGCSHNSCRGKHWSEFRDAVEPGWRTIRPTTSRVRREVNGSGTVISKVDDRTVSTVPLTGSTGQDHSDGDWDGGELLTEVTPEHVEWLWEGYIPLGKLTVGDGDPGLGKTMLFAADLAARVTTGEAMPDGTPGIPGGAGVAIFTAEDDPADTLQPRFVAAGGDESKVVVVTTIRRSDPTSGTGAILERLPTFADLAFIERKIQQVDAKLVIFDPYVAYLPHKVDSHRDQDVRSALAPLARLAQKTGAAFVLIRHLNRGGFNNALYRGMGSIGIIGAARAGLLVVKDPDDENLRIVGQTKSNLGRPKPSWKYRIIEDDRGMPRIQWEGQSERDAKEVLNNSGDKDTPSKLEAACDLLRAALKNGERAEEYLKGEAKAQGISLATLRRAKKLFHIQSYKHGVGKAGYWVWSLLDKDDQGNRKDVHTNNDDHLSENTGHNDSQQANLLKGDQGGGYEHLSDLDAHLNNNDEEEGEEQWTL